MKAALLALAALLVVYVLANVVVIAFVPVLWHVDVEVRVVDAAGGGAPAGTRVQLLARGGGELGAARALEPDGTAVFDVVHQQQPAWMWPRLGALKLEEKVRARAADGRTKVVDLASALS